MGERDSGRDVYAMFMGTVAGSKFSAHDTNIYLDLVPQPYYVSHQPRSSRGAFMRRSWKAERGVACCGLATRNRAPAGPGPRPPGTRTWPRGARSTDPEAMPETRSAAPGPKSPRWSAERRASPAGDATGVPRFGTQRVPLHPRAVSALRHPSGVENEISGAIRRGKEREGDEVGERGKGQIVGWVERLRDPTPRAGRAMLGLARSARSTQPTAWRCSPGYLTS